VSSGGMGVRLKDVALEAGVSLSTASRVLSRPRRPGASETAATRRVRSVAARLGYRPNMTAASLRTRRTKLLGVLVPHLTDVVLSTIYEGIDAAASAAGYQSVVANTMDNLDEQRSRAENLLHRGVDGLVFGDAHFDDPYLEELAARDVPFVLVSRRHAPFSSATCDDVAGGRLVGNHLADLGHREIGIIAGAPYASTGSDRAQGFLAALRERGIAVPAHHLIPSGFGPEDGYRAALLLLSREPRPTAIFAVNDMTAIGAIGALRDQGYDVGSDIAVVGFNDISIAAHLPIPLTTVRSPLMEMGREAARLVLNRFEGGGQGRSGKEGATDVRLQPQLIVRKSSDSSVQLRQMHSQASFSTAFTPLTSLMERTRFVENRVGSNSTPTSRVAPRSEAPPPQAGENGIARHLQAGEVVE
jgi:LacI family transcriptional regulator